jgi:hypothetical protein
MYSYYLVWEVEFQGMVENYMMVLYQEVVRPCLVVVVMTYLVQQHCMEVDSLDAL